MKKVISLFLVMVLVFSVSSIATITADASTIIKGTYGKNIKYSWNKKTSVITIYGKGRMKEPKVWNGVPWNNSSIKKAIVKEGVTGLCSFAFCWCSLDSISLPDSLTYIGHLVFEMNSIKSITIPKNVKYIGYNVFKSNKNLKAINVAKENKYYKSIDGVLYNNSCSILAACPPKKTGTLVLPDTLCAVNGEAFFNCKITGLVFPASFEKMCDDTLKRASKIRYYKVAKDNKYYYSKDGLLYDKLKKRLVKVPPAKSGNVKIDEGTTAINQDALCPSAGLIDTITMPNSVETICEGGLGGSSKVVKLGKGVKYLGKYSLRGADTVIINSGIETVKDYAFRGNVKAYYDIKNISKNAFEDATVYTHCNVKTVINHCKKYKDGKLKVLHVFSEIYEKKAPSYFDVGYTKGYCKYCKKTEYNYKAKLKLKSPDSFKVKRKNDRLYFNMPKITGATGYQVKPDHNPLVTINKRKFSVRIKVDCGWASARAYVKKGKRIVYSPWTEGKFCGN